jgi:hypothetical protein
MTDTMLVVDTSNQNGNPNVYARWPQYRNAAGLIVQAIPRGPITPATQLEYGRQSGKLLAAYSWLWDDPNWRLAATVLQDQRLRWATIPRDVVLHGRGWVDAEDNQSALGKADVESQEAGRGRIIPLATRKDNLLRALDAAEFLVAEGGVYTSPYYIDRLYDGWLPEGRKIWLASYGIRPGSVLGQRNGLVVGHQFTGDTIDQSVFYASEFQLAPAAPTPETPFVGMAVNIDARNEVAWSITQPAKLVADGFKGVRLTSYPDVQGRIDALVNAGLAVMAIIHPTDSQGYVPWNATFLQIGNEPDAPGSFMSPQEYADMWVIYRNTYPQFAGRFVMAGLASGGDAAIQYARDVFAAIGDRAPLPDVIAIHPYTLTTQQASDQFDAMWNAFNIPVIATEWWKNHTENDTWNFQCMLNNNPDGRSRIWNSWFCYTDAMVSPFGLTDRDGNRKDEYYALLSAPGDCRNV